MTSNESEALTGAMIDQMKRTIDDCSAIIVEHRHFRGARAPSRLIFDDGAALESYLRTHAVAGDALYFWKYEDCCTDTNFACRGKVPDAEGNIPQGGAY